MSDPGIKNLVQLTKIRRELEEALDEFAPGDMDTPEIHALLNEIATLALRTRLDEEQEFQTYLKALQDITLELTLVDGLDDFYRRVVELGRERLGFDRLALFLYDPRNGIARGTYGTDDLGNLSDERHMKFIPAEAGVMQRALQRDERFYLDQNVPLTSYQEPKGTGWNAAALLWNGTESLGWLTADNLLSHQPATKPRLDILALYSLSVGTLLARRQVEEALRDQRNFLQLVINHMPALIVVKDAAGRYQMTNTLMAEFYETTPEAMIGNTDADVNPDLEEVAVSAERDREALDAKQPALTTEEVRQGLYFQTIRIPLKGAGGDYDRLLIVAEDITKLRQSAAELELQRAFLQQVIDLSPSMIFVKDYDARFVLVNHLVAQMYNTTVADLIGKSDADFNADMQEVRDFMEADRQVISSGESLFVEEPLTSATGDTHWLQTTKVPILSADGQSKYVLGVATDITERRKTETALREQHDFLQKVINNVPGLIIVKDRDGHFQLVNEPVARIYNTTPAEMLGKTDADFNPNPAEVEFFLQKDRETLATGQPVFIAEETVLNRYYQTSKIPLQNHSGVYDRLLVVASDITARKVAEEALRQALEKERELGELKSRFVSIASHEFRTPLAIILTSAEALSLYRHRLDEAQINRKLSKIREQIGYLRNIIEGVLELERIQTGHMKFNPVSLDLDRLCRDIIEEFQHVASVVYTSAQAPAFVRADNRLMHQVINNLISNAIKYSSPQKQVYVSLEPEGERVVLRVRDEGIGIPAADLKHLFEPFHRATNVGTISGTGLGLSITRQAVELHNGSISVESQVSVGTTFTVSIPAPVDSGDGP